MLFAEKPLIRLPRELPPGSLPPKATIAKVRAAILAHHPQLGGGVLEKGLGFASMHDESRLFVAVLKKLMVREVTALPMHDGIMVAASHATK
jgi:hypothetical protein